MRYASPRFAVAVLAAACVLVGPLTGSLPVAPAFASAPAALTAGVYPLHNANADRIAKILRVLYPAAKIVTDRGSNSIVAFAKPDAVEQMRAIIAQLDVRGPAVAQRTAISVGTVSVSSLIPKLRQLFPNSHFSEGPNKSVLVDATPADLLQIKDIVASVDVTPTPAPAAPHSSDAVKVEQAQSSDVARIVRSQVPNLRATSSGDMVLLGGPPDAVAQAKTLIAALDRPANSVPATQIYRLRSVDAQSVADLLSHSFPGVSVSVEKDLNALTVVAPPATQTRIAAGIAQLDGGVHVTHSVGVAQPGAVSPALDAGDGQNVEVVSLRAAVPAAGTAGGTTTATDIANTVLAALQRSAPGLRVSVQPNSTQLVLTGTADEIRLGRELIEQLDVAQKLVVLDTQILEIDETAAKNLGLSINTPTGATVPSISTTYSENVPTPQPGFSSPPQFLGLLPFTRTGLSIGLTLGLLVQRGDAKILADPRVATISGRTATIRAGDNITVQTQAGGGTGTVATTQLQTFQTGVSLDITPVIDAGNFVTLTLHPVVNNLSGYSNSLPQISTRDTQTTVALQADQTLVIGGLIEDSTTNTITKIPYLGDLPLVGRLFQNRNYSHTRNELVITVTPHIIDPSSAAPGSTLGVDSNLPLPKPEPLPTLEPGTLLPTPRSLGFQTSKPFVSAPIAALPSASAPPHPLATPSAFAASNVFTYGSPPQNNFALPSDAVRIYYVTVSPTIMKNNTTFNISAITSSNVSQLVLDTNSGPQIIAHTGAPGFWQASILFTGGSVPAGQNQLSFTLNASKESGETQRLAIPVSVSP